MKWTPTIAALTLAPLCGWTQETVGTPGADRSIIYQPAEGIPGTATEEEWPVAASPGPHILIDDYLIAESDGVDRVVIQPRREASIPNPIVNAADDHNFQPYLTVVRAPDSGRYRIWYGAFREDRATGRSQLCTMESEDGIHFERPHTVCQTPEIQFGSEVIDRGAEYPDPASRYVYSYYLESGLRILQSSDGIVWTPLVDGVVLDHNHDINGIDWDSLRNRYMATISTYTEGANWSGKRRTTMMSVSDDLIHWEDPWYIVTASDELDEGETQFYAMEGYLNRGPLRIGMVKILRDDLRATGTAEGSFGRAHTSLAWSRDGNTWVRDREKFFEPDDDPAAWDHAHAWIDEQLIVGDQVYLYYGGYKQGHKMNRFEERQIGLVRMPLDRYVARRASRATPGTLRTVPFRISEVNKVLTVNANVHGALRVALRDGATGDVVPGFGLDECEPMAGDQLRHVVRWGNNALPTEKSVSVEFELEQADLFAFSFE